MSAIPLRQKQPVEYPESDGRPMAETDLHRDEMVYVIEALQAYFRDAPDVYVSGNLLLYYVEGDPSSSVSPDALVARGVARAKERRRIYKLWEEGQTPYCVFEVTSVHTRREDLRRKNDLYERLGVEELFLYDPMAEYLRPPLQGFRLSAAGSYEPVQPEPDGSLFSQTTGLLLQREGTALHLVDPATGQRLLRRTDLEENFSQERKARLLAESRAAQAERRAADMEDEMARLRAELSRLKTSG